MSEPQETIVEALVRLSDDDLDAWAERARLDTPLPVLVEILSRVAARRPPPSGVIWN